MRFTFLLGLVLTAATFIPQSSKAACVNCQIQSREPSTKTPGKFDFRISCIDDASGDEINSLITAGGDEEALQQMLAAKC